jgi:TPR repeat protein
MLVSAIAVAGDYEDGVAALTRGDYGAAYSKFRQAAEQSDARAQSSLASMYYNGLGVPKDYRQALYWYTKAAKQGHAGAQYNLGLMYAEGIGIARNYEQALYWYTKAAEQGHAEALGRKRKWKITIQETPEVAPPRTATSPQLVRTGTGFYVSSKGHVLTNKHVINGCLSLELEPIGKPMFRGQVLATDAQNDLAIISSVDRPSRFAKFRSGAIRQGEFVVLYGFPLAGALASSGNATTGNVTALAGIQDDARIIQISAPVQPGNSGGPLMDMSGGVVGVVVAKLNAAKVMEALGDIPQNVNFAIKADVAKDFLESHDIKHERLSRRKNLSVPDVVDVARSVSVRILCYR